MANMRLSCSILSLAVVCAGIGCSSPEPVETPEAVHEHTHDHAHDDGHDDHHHHHEAPHGGTLVEIGDHVAHLELLLDAETGTLTMYVLDGGAEAPVRLEDMEILVSLETTAGDLVAATFVPVTNALTGESAGDSSQFALVEPKLIGQEAFTLSIPEISVRGVKAMAITVQYPDGNE